MSAPKSERDASTVTSNSSTLTTPPSAWRAASLRSRLAVTPLASMDARVSQNVIVTARSPSQLTRK